MIGLFLLLFLIFILLPLGLGILIFFLIKQYWNKKYAKYFAIGYSVIFLLIAGRIIFEDQLFLKKDALELLNEQNINLEDDFIIIKNESFSGIGDYYHTFELEISEKDKRKGINEIKSSKDFITIEQKIINFPYSPEINRYKGSKKIQNYETENGFVREYFQPNGQGYAPTFRRIKLNKKDNILIFEDIDD